MMFIVFREIGQGGLVVILIGRELEKKIFGGVLGLSEIILVN